MSSSVLPDHVGVRILIARFLGWPKRLLEEPRPSMEVEDVLTRACHRIDEQDAKLKFQGMQLRLRDVEIELLQSDVEWLVAVVKGTNAVLATDDYIRLQQVMVKVRTTRSR